MIPISSDKDNGNTGFWEQNLEKIDTKLKEFYSDSKYAAKEGYAELENNFKNWMDEQSADSSAKAEWEKLKNDSKMLKDKLQNRVQHLAEKGKIKYSEWTSSSSGD